MAGCNLSLPCSQTSSSDPITHTYVFEISTAGGDTGSAIVGSSESGIGISGNSLNGTNSALGIGVRGTTQKGIAGQFNSSQSIGIQASAGLPDGGNPDIQGIGVQASSTGGTAVQASSTGGTAVQANSTGGTAGLFNNSIAEDLSANDNPALNVGTTGTGAAASVHIDNVSSFATALNVVTTGYGGAASLHINNVKNYTTALDAGTTGTGGAASVHIDNVKSYANALEAETAGLGSAAYFHNDNSSNPYPALVVTTSGTNAAATFQKLGGGSEATVVAVSSQNGGNAAEFYGSVDVVGTLKASAKSFLIDHPLDPANKYLAYASIESSEQACVYSGNVVLDHKGEAVVNLPVWVEAVNEDFRYQLTCIGGSAQVYIADQVANNQFRIGGGTAGMKVSWQLTGIRKDAWAKAYPLVVEQDKPEEEKGYFRHPELFRSDQQHSIAHLRVPKVNELSY